jgi:hypothetical protein
MTMGEIRIGDFQWKDEADAEGQRLYEAGLCDDFYTIYHHGLYALYVYTI